MRNTPSRMVPSGRQSTFRFADCTEMLNKRAISGTDQGLRFSFVGGFCFEPGTPWFTLAAAVAGRGAAAGGDVAFFLWGLAPMYLMPPVYRSGAVTVALGLTPASLRTRQ